MADEKKDTQSKIFLAASKFAVFLNEMDQKLPKNNAKQIARYDDK